ncbi:MAG: polyphosphate polymerase domain-containing protein [Sphingobacteriaceae bacterium]
MQVPELDFFDQISLEELQERAPMNRRLDRKYLISQDKLAVVLTACASDYQLLAIKGNRVFAYGTWYYDTPEYTLYHHHHQGKGNRFKVRKRLYAHSGETYVELKCKNNKGVTEKYRVAAANVAEASEFVFAHSGLHSESLIESLAIHYQRITLLHKTKPEKVTLDFNLEFRAGQAQADFTNLVIAEVKTEKGRDMDFAKLMKELGIRSGSISKYCLGLIALNQAIKFNTFKPIYRRFAALNQAS